MYNPQAKWGYPFLFQGDFTRMALRLPRDWRLSTDFEPLSPQNRGMRGRNPAQLPTGIPPSAHKFLLQDLPRFGVKSALRRT